MHYQFAPTPEEVSRIAQQIPINSMLDALDIYAYEATQSLRVEEKEGAWIHSKALHSVFIAGYMTGKRQERRKKRLKGDSRSF